MTTGTPALRDAPNYYITEHFRYGDLICPCCDQTAHPQASVNLFRAGWAVSLRFDCWALALISSRAGLSAPSAGCETFFSRERSGNSRAKRCLEGKCRGWNVVVVTDLLQDRDRCPRDNFRRQPARRRCRCRCRRSWRC